MRNLNFLSLCLSSVILLASCAKDGEMGATGPQGSSGVNGTNGANGTNGTSGANGTNGTNGAPGTANVIYSAWATDASMQWSDTTASGIDFKRAIITGVSLTDSVVNYGAVMVYAKSADGSVKNLPLSVYQGANAADFDRYSSEAQVGSIVLFHTRATANVFAAPTELNNLSFRYVIIPGGASAAVGTGTTGGRIASGPATGYTISQLKNMTYAQVAALLKIKG